MKYEFPANYGEDCILVPIDKSLVPLVAGALKHFEQRSWWVSEQDYEQGYNAFAQLQADMTGKCVADLIAIQEKTYRLLDTALNGTQYTAGAVDPETGAQLVTPAIPAAPPVGTSAENAMRAHVGRIWQLAENSTAGRTFAAGAGIEGSPALDDNVSVRDTLRAMQGIINAGWFGIGGKQATIADLINSVRLGSEAEQEKVYTALDAMVGASSGLSIFDTIRGLFTESADLTLEGGQIAVQLVAAMGQIISNNLLSQQIERILETLGGDGLIGPPDSILQALRGDTPASAERNVIDTQGGAGGQLPDLAELESDLEAIRQAVQ